MVVVRCRVWALQVIYDRSNNSKGFGFVNFVEEDSMKKAIDKASGCHRCCVWIFWVRVSVV